jgi:hypothetical protein
MSSKQTFFLRTKQARQLAVECCKTAPDNFCVIFAPKRRSLEQNAAQFPWLQGFSNQLKWPVNGEMVYLTSTEWKDILTSAYEGEVEPKLAQGWEGGNVMLGKRTSSYNKEQFSEWLEWLMAAATLKGITPIYKYQRGRNESIGKDLSR